MVNSLNFRVPRRYYAFFSTPLWDAASPTKPLNSRRNEHFFIAFLSLLFSSRYFRTTMLPERPTSFQVRSLYRFFFGRALHFLYQEAVSFRAIERGESGHGYTGLYDQDSRHRRGPSAHATGASRQPP